MSNAMKYIKDLEAAGFERSQAEAQVQMVLDAIEGDLVTKTDFAIFQERIENRFDSRFSEISHRIDKQFAETQKQFVEVESRLLTRLGFLIIGTVSIGVAVLTWLIKI